MAVVRPPASDMARPGNTAMIDLHTHSTASDGRLSPAALVSYAHEKGLEALALTDHDTVEGLAEALAAGQQLGLEVLPGIEISADWPESTLHILGYFIDYHDGQLLERLRILQDARNRRNPEIIRKLCSLGCDITLEEVMAEAITGQVGRPHIAQVLLQKGYVKSSQEAFDRYLRKGGAAYVDKFRFDPREAISMIRAAGGLAVLAHPSTLAIRNSAELDAFVVAMKGCGLTGIEAFYSEHTPQQTRLYQEVARRHRLLVTGGSDFHGAYIKGIDLGIGNGNLAVPYSLVAELKQAHRLMPGPS